MKEFDSKLRSAELHLAKSDKVMSDLIDKLGPCTLFPSKDYFSSIVESIIGQQLSAKAADTIYSRFILLAGDCVPDSILKLHGEAFRKAGISRQKEVYIKEFSAMITEHPDYFNQFEKLDDDDLLKKLTSVKGVGTWTAHMFLIFNMGRLDVLPLSDAGFRRSFNELYNGNGERLDDLKILSVSNKWKPFRSIGAWYLWKYIDSKPHP